MNDNTFVPDSPDNFTEDDNQGVIPAETPDFEEVAEEIVDTDIDLAFDESDQTDLAEPQNIPEEVSDEATTPSARPYLVNGYELPPFQKPDESSIPPYGNPQSPYGYAPYQATTPVKKNKGKTAFLICLWVLVGIFAVGFFVLCGYVAGRDYNEGSTAPTLFEEPDVTEPNLTEPKETLPDDKNEGNNVVVIPDDNDVYSKDNSLELNKVPADHNNSNKYTTKYAYNKVLDSTVGVVCYTDSFTDEPESQGTGIIISDNGYIVTNSHVIGDSRSAYNVQVITNDQTTYEAKIIGYDSRTDLAVLKINADDLPEAEFCDSALVEVGDDVIAVGNPGGIEFQNSLTRGVVSALDRELSLSANVSYIQTDAAINPGNSGGPLCNIYGQVIGINTAKISSSSFEGMGFAIPSRTVKEIVDDLVAQGYVNDRVRLGISGTEVTSSMVQYYNAPQGILVGEISVGGPCENSGLMINDIITAIDDTEITSFSEVYGILAEHKAGDKVTLSVYRMSSDETLKIEIVLMADEGQTQQ